MTKITAAEVNKLRQQTGAGMMDCKKALVENDGDFDKAIDYLRKKGQKIANKRADKAANEGIVLSKINSDNNFAAIIMFNCETDFVAKTQDFIDFVNKIIDKAIADKPKSLIECKELKLNGRTISESITDLMGKTGEKMDLAQYQYIESPLVFAYNHQGNRLATILGFNKNNSPKEIGHEIAMQIAAMNPVAIDKDNVDPKIIEKEIEIGKEQARQEGKPDNMIEKIAIGKLNRFYKESTLLNQVFIRDNKKTVGQYLNDNDKELKITDFKRLMLGV
ncbi:MAG: translation elongation factor Ts [Bacteroidales bacterium]|nr:translation elongation factor Ts [Bacteroidales bacterium]